MTIDAITGLPTAPNRSQGEAGYSSTADAWAGDLDRWTTDLNTFGDQANAVGVQASADALTALNASTTATAAANTAAASANFAGEWSTLTGALNVPASVFHNGAYWNLLNNLADVTASEPSVTADWTVLFGGPVISLTTLGVVSKGDLITVNSDGTVSIITGNDQGAGSPLVVGPNIAGKTQRIVAIPNTNVAVMVYCNVAASTVGTAVAFEFDSSGAIITVGTPVTFTGGVFTTTVGAKWDPLSSRVIITYTPNPGFNSLVLSCSVTGVALSFGTVTGQFETNKNAIDYRLAYDTVAQKHLCVYWWQTGGGNYGTVLTGSTISPAYNPTFGTSVLFGGVTASSLAIDFSPTVAKFLIIWIDNAGHPQIQAATITGTVPSFSAEVQAYSITTNNPLCAHRTNGVNDQFLVGWRDTTTNEIILAAYFTGLFARNPAGDERTFALSYNATDDVFALTFANSSLSNFAELRTIILNTGGGITISDSSTIFVSESTDNVDMDWSEDTNQFAFGYEDVSGGLGTGAIVKSLGGNLLHGGYAGVALEDALTASPVTVGLAGTTSPDQTGLSTGLEYHIEVDGTLGFTKTQPIAGIALSATELLIKG